MRNATKTISKSVIDHGSYRIIAQFLKNKQKQVILRNNTNVWVSSLAERKVPYYTKWTIQQLQGTRYLLVILTHSPAGKTQRDFQGQPHKRVVALSILKTQFSKYWGRSRSLLLSLSRRPSKSVCVRGLLLLRILTAHIIPVASSRYVIHPAHALRKYVQASIGLGTANLACNLLS